MVCQGASSAAGNAEKHREELEICCNERVYVICVTCNVCSVKRDVVLNCWLCRIQESALLDVTGDVRDSTDCGKVRRLARGVIDSGSKVGGARDHRRLSG